MNSDILLQTDRAAIVRHGRCLEYFTIAYNSLEGLIAVGAGLMVGSMRMLRGALVVH